MRLKVLLPAVLTVALLAMAGCGGAANQSLAPEGSREGQEQVSSSISPTIEGGSSEYKTIDEKDAAQTAIRYAQEANTGSDFKALRVVVIDGWARVDIEETEVPRDEAIGFGVFEKKNEKGSWDMITSGTGITQEDVPGAPGQLFEP